MSPTEQVSSLILGVEPMTPDCPLEIVGELFLRHENRHLLSLPVVDNGRPVGIISRYHVLKIFLMAYGRELYGKRAIQHFMNPNPLLLEQDVPLELASQYITNNMQFPITEDFIITRESRYCGVGMVMDLLRAITDLKFRAYDRELAQKVVQLEQRSLELQDAMQEARAASQAKSRFLANMSHELRTPLNAIIGYSEIIAEDLLDAGQTDSLTDLEQIKKAGTHLLGIISDVLDLSKIEAGKMQLQLETFELSDFIDEIISLIKPIMEKNTNHLVLAMPSVLGTMHADKNKVRQALLNILSNAAKFSKQADVVFAMTSHSDASGHWVIFSVKDQGIGMNQEQISRLFQPFMQADNSSTRVYGGTGLGLAITKQFCEMQGGQVGVTSQAGKGSTFTLSLPRVVLETVPAPPAPLKPAVVYAHTCQMVYG